MKINLTKKRYLLALTVSGVITAAFLSLDSKEPHQAEIPVWLRDKAAVEVAANPKGHEELVEKSWVEQVKSNIAAEQQAFHKTVDGSYSTYNASNFMHSSITPAGMKVSGYPTRSSKWEVALNFKSVSSEFGKIETGSIQEVTNNGSNLTYQYENIALQYVNTNEGLRQNFIVNSAPSAAKHLSVNLDIESSLNAQMISNSLILSHNGVRLYQYKDLKVWDKNGTILPAKMELQDDALALSVDISDAQFPVTIDPISTTYAWKVTGGQVAANMGFWVSGRGDLNGDGFSDVVVGLTNYSHVLNGEGAVYVYYGSAAGLHLTPDWVAYGEQDSSLFGRSVSTEGDVNGDGFDDLLVGAAQVRQPLNDEGKVYLYLGSASGLATTPVWTFVSGRKHAKLGDVAIVGDTDNDGFDDIVVGAHGWDNTEDLGEMGNKAGKFWVFMGTDAGTGVDPVPFMSCAGQDEDANLGVSVDAGGDVNGDSFADIQIGGYIFLIGDGMICTFNGGEEGPDNIPDFMAIGGAHDTSFYAVNLSRAGDLNGDGFDDVVIGMPRFDTYGVYNAGKLRYHFGGEFGIDTTKYDILGEGQYDERYAFNVNDGGDLNKDGYDDLLVTAKHYAPPSSPDDSVGRGYLYLGGPNGPSHTPAWTFDGESVSGVGTNIASAGDVNGDGLIDILLSSDSYTGTFEQEGAAYLFYGIEQVCEPPKAFASPGVGPTSATFTWDWVYGSYVYKVYIKKVGSTAPPIVITTQNNSVTVTGLSSGSTYKCYVKCKCQAGWTGRSNMKTIRTPPGFEKESVGLFSDLNIYPNPVSDVLNVSTQDAGTIQSVNIYSVQGDLVISKNYSAGEQTQLLQITETEKLPSGTYFIQISNGVETAVKKFTKSK